MKTCTHLLITLFFSFILFLTYGNFSNTFAENANLVSNASFEYGTDVPYGWKTSNSTTCLDSQETLSLSFEWSNDIVRTESHSLSLQNISWSDTNPWIPGHWISNDFIDVVHSINKYEISGWAYPNESRLKPVFYICRFDMNGNFRGEERLNPFSNLTPGEWSLVKFNTINFVGAEKIKIGLGVICTQTVPSSPCQGNIVFDDIVLRPTGAIVGHKFEDSNKNSSQDLNEASLADWEFLLFYQADCTGNWREGGWTSTNGYRIFTGGFQPLLPGNYSILETFWTINREGQRLRLEYAKDKGWINTTLVCQNVTLEAGETPLVSFGNIKGSSVPYLSQIDPQWASQTYDHASSVDPFFCGTTIGGCGCAITSSAMLLKYYGVDKAPGGSPTNPQTLNDWLKANNGYAFGALKWNSIAAFALKANQNFGTQKIMFTGIGNPNSYSDLNSELTNNQPTILEEPGHFVLATATQGNTYAINDPRWQNKTDLTSYNNQFLSTRKFQKTSTDLSAIYISSPAPSDLFITDSQGRRAGKDPTTGEIFTDIPNSFYFIEPTILDTSQEGAPDPNSGVTSLIILTPQDDNFEVLTNGNDIDFSIYDKNGDIHSQTIHESSTENSQFELNFSPEPGSVLSLVKRINIDVKPDTEENPISIKSGPIPVAILTTPNFNTDSVDPDTLTFGRNEIPPFSGKYHFEDTDADGDTDLITQFVARDTGFKSGDTQVCLSGKTLQYLSFKGCDHIRLVGFSSQ